MKVIRLKDLIDDIKGSKNISKKNIMRVVSALPKVMMLMLLKKEEIKFTAFFKLGFRVAKDRIIKSSITKEMLHIPQHLRFKATFYNEFKHFLNKD